VTIELIILITLYFISDGIKFKILSPVTIYSAIIYGALVTFSYVCLSTAYINITTLDFKMAEIVLYISLTSFPAIVVVGLLSILETHKVVKYIKEWDDFQVCYLLLRMLSCRVRFPTTGKIH